MTPIYSVTASLYETCQVEADNELDAISKARDICRSIYGGLIFDEYEVEQLEEEDTYDDADDWNTPEHE